MTDHRTTERYRFWWIFLAAYIMLLVFWLLIATINPKDRAPDIWPETDFSSLRTNQSIETQPSAALLDTAVPEIALSEIDWKPLIMAMLDLINQSRQEIGVTALAWDDLAASTAQQHAEEMAENAYLSHWNRHGEGADIRFARNGGSDVVSENVYAYSHRYDSGIPVPVEDWNEYLLEAHESFMNSIQHRENILSPEHTHIGIGLAYQPETGEFRVVQEFINQYIRFDSLPSEIGLDEDVVIIGRMGEGIENPLAVLYYEPFSEPISIDALNQTAAFVSSAEQMGIVSVINRGNSQFSVTLPDREAAGVYHLRIWVSKDGTQIPASDLIFWVHESQSNNADQTNNVGEESTDEVPAFQEAANFSLPDLDGDQISLYELQAQPVLLIFFQAREEFNQQARYLQFLTDLYQETDIQMIGLSLEEPEVLKAYVEEVGWAFPVISNVSGSVFSQYPLDGFPTFVFVNTERELESVLKQPSSLGEIEVWLVQFLVK